MHKFLVVVEETGKYSLVWAIARVKRRPAY